MNLHGVGGHVKSDITGMQKIVGEILLNNITLIATANDEIVDAEMAVDLQDVPKNRFAADLDHGLGAHASFLGDACTEAACENDRFHEYRESRQFQTAEEYKRIPINICATQ